MKKAYDDGIISKDFATLKNTQLRDLVKASRAGGWFDAMNPTWLLTGEMRRTNPAADLLALTSLEGPNGKYTQRDPGNYGMIVIPKRVNEKKLMRILDFMDYGATEEGWVFANFGQEGVHHNLVDGIRIFTDAGTKAVAPAGMLNFYANLDKYARAIQVGIPPDFYKRNRDIIDQRAKISIPDYAYGLQSDTWDKLGKEYLKKATDLKVKIILGMEPIDAWDAYVKQLKTDPDFQKIIKEINTSYKKK
jgi:putative aldouronate transport system substrate-binding protein